MTIPRLFHDIEQYPSHLYAAHHAHGGGRGHAVKSRPPSLWMYTTNRCMPTPSRSPYAIFLIAISAVIFCASAIFSLNSAAQTRDFPASALRGSLQVTLPPQVEMDGKADQLSPGARIHGTNNLLVLSGSLVGQTMWVNYTRDTSGLLSEIWILTEAEAALERNGAKPKRFFFF